MRLAIDATSISSGGGLTHLVELLRHADPAVSGVADVFVWSSRETLSRIEDRAWLHKRTDPEIEKSFLFRALWIRRNFARLCREVQADVAFVPSGSIVTDFKPTVTMSQNMLPFEWRELRRFGFSAVTLKMLALRVVQAASFLKAAGVIFLTNYARDTIFSAIGPLKGRHIIVSHGIDERFFISLPNLREPDDFTDDKPLKIVYVSTIDAYKHQWRVVEAIRLLVEAGLPATVDFYGTARPAYWARLKQALVAHDPEGVLAKYRGFADYSEIEKVYEGADMVVFASSCENLPNTLIEAMATGLPVACSWMGPMPEVLRDGGVYFDPVDPKSISDAIIELAENVELRGSLSAKARAYARAYSWRQCASETFTFLAKVADNDQKSQ